MKKYTYLVTALVAGFIATFAFAGTARAIVNGPPVDFSKSASSATANGSSKITFTVYVYQYVCDNGNLPLGSGACADGSTTHKQGIKNWEINIAVTGSGNTLGGTHAGTNGVTAVTTGDDGKASFTLASSVAESKKVTVFHSDGQNAAHADNPSATVTFTAPPAPAPAPAPAPVEPSPPEAPKAATLQVNGQAVTAESVVLPADQELTLGGTTVANGVVKLYIFSDPKEATVTADAQGNWIYGVSGLEPGEHRVEAEVTDPTTNKTSARAVLAAFTVEAPAPAVVAATESPKNTTLPLIIASVIALVLATGAAAGWWLWQRKKQLKNGPGLPTATDNTESKPPTITPSAK